MKKRPHGEYFTTVKDINIEDKYMPMNDHYFVWSYTMSGFTGMGHEDVSGKPGGAAIKMNCTTVTEDGKKKHRQAL